MRVCTIACVLGLLLAWNAATANPEGLPPGTEITQLRTEFPNTCSAGDGRLAARICPVPIDRLDEDGSWQPVGETDGEIVRCHPGLLLRWTVNVHSMSSRHPRV